MLARAEGLRYQRIAGLPYAGLPIAVAMSLESGVPLIYPRKEVKGYGTQRQIEGSFAKGERVLVVDDVITSGCAKIEAIAPLRDAGLVAEDVLVLVDRSADRGAALRPHGATLHSVVRVEDLAAPALRERRDHCRAVAHGRGFPRRRLGAFSRPGLIRLDNSA